MLNRWANPSDIADASFLGSDLASYINGQEIYVDGGWLSKGLKKINFDEQKKIFTYW